jgi:hypothetical protein
MHFNDVASFDRMRQIVSENYRRRFAVRVRIDLSLAEPLSTQRSLGLFGSKTLVLKSQGQAERQLKLSCDATDFLCRIAFAAVEAERQTQDHLTNVKLLAQFVEGFDELLPVRAAQRLERSHGQAHLVGDGDADALRPQVEREDAARGMRTLFVPAEFF